MFKSLTVLLVLFANFAQVTNASENHSITDFSIHDAWIAEAPPVSRVMVAYLTIKNHTSENIEIIRAESELYSSIEFHETKHEDGMARMIRHSNLSIPANSSITLKRGGKHLMLFNPTKRLKAGDTVNIKFSTKNNIEKTISVTIIKAQYQ